MNPDGVEMFVLDTDHITIRQTHDQPEFAHLTQRMAQRPAGEFYYAVVSFHEQVLGANVYINRARTEQELADGYELLQRMLAEYGTAQVLPFDRAAARVFNSLRAQKVRIGTMD